MEVYYYPSFLRQLKKLSKAVRETAIERTKVFQENPHNPQLKLHKLDGSLKGYWSFSVDYHHRIILEIRDNQVMFHFIGNHSIYQD